MENQKKIILVTGATGHQGGAVAKELLKDNKFAVHAFVRDPEKPHALTLKEAGAKLVKGDFEEPDSIAEALEGVYGIFSVQQYLDGIDSEIRHGKAVADAAQAAAVKHFVYASVGSANQKTGIPHFDSKYEIEQYIKQLSLPYTIMRPVFFMYNYQRMKSINEQNTIYMPLKPTTKLQQISEDDYAKMVAQVFTQPDKFIGEEIDIASTELTMEEVAETFSEVMKKTINYQQVPFEQFKQQAGKEMAVMFRWFEEVGYKADLNQLEKTFFKLMNLKTYIQKHFTD